MSLISHAVGFRRKRMNDKCCREKKPGTQKKKKMKEGQWMTDGFPSRLKIMQCGVVLRVPVPGWMIGHPSGESKSRIKQNRSQNKMLIALVKLEIRCKSAMYQVQGEWKR